MQGTNGVQQFIYAPERACLRSAEELIHQATGGRCKVLPIQLSHRGAASSVTLRPSDSKEEGVVSGVVAAARAWPPKLRRLRLLPSEVQKNALLTIEL